MRGHESPIDHISAGREGFLLRSSIRGMAAKSSARIVDKVPPKLPMGVLIASTM